MTGPGFRRGSALALAIFGVASARFAVGAGETAETVSHDAETARMLRRRLEDARAFRAQGRGEAAEGALRRGLAIDPDAAALHRMLARLLAEDGRLEEAAGHRARADALAPPLPPPPDTPLRADASDVLVILVSPGPSDEHPERTAANWPEGQVARVLEDRLRVRLPGASVVHASLDRVALAHRWLAARKPRVALSLRAERSWCGETLKDGAFALVWLRAGAAGPGIPTAGPGIVRQVVEDPPAGPTCEREATARALEQVFALPDVASALASSATLPSKGIWTSAGVHALFPDIARGVAAEIESGRARLAQGDLLGADLAFRRAAHIDPHDPDVRAYLAEVDASLDLLQAVTAPGPGPAGTLGPPGQLDARPTPAQRRAAEARLREERRLGDDLLAALAVLDEDRRPPSGPILDRLRPVDIQDPEAFGPTTARSRAGGPVEARAAYAPDGAALARYYFAAGGTAPLLREEDTNGDGLPDRWILYRGGSRREVWEDSGGRGRPDLRLVFAPGGDPLVRIEFDSRGSGHPERVFRYADGSLASESRDTTNDGRLDRVDHFDGDGQLREREEDLDGDGQVDLRSFYRAGRLERREVAKPEQAPGES